MSQETPQENPQNDNPGDSIEGILIGFGAIAIIIISFIFVKCILPLVDKFCSTHVGPAWIPRIRESETNATKFMPALTKEERIMVLEKVFQSQSYPEVMALLESKNNGSEKSASAKQSDDSDLDVHLSIRSNRSIKVSPDNGGAIIDENGGEFENTSVKDASRDAENESFEKDNDLENSYTTKENKHETGVDEKVEIEKDSVETNQPSLNILTMIMSKFEVREEKEVIEDDFCPICMEEYEEDCCITSGTQCDHFFHKHCIIKWMEKHDICPICRKDMMTSNEFEKGAEITLGKTRFLEAKAAIESQEEN